MPYGIIDGDLEPRWTYGKADGSITAMEYLDPLPNAITPVRMVQKQHKIMGDSVNDRDVYIDLTQDEEDANKKSSRLLIRSNLERIRDRNKSDDFEPENIVPVTGKEIKRTIRKIESNAATIRKHFLNDVIPLMVGYDIAAGEAEAIARDELETDIEIDSEIALYLERITVAALLKRTMLRKFDKDFTDVQMAEWLKEEFAQVRAQVKTENGSNGNRRFLDQLRGLIAQRKDPNRDPDELQPIGIKKSFRSGPPEFIFDR